MRGVFFEIFFRINVNFYLYIILFLCSYFVSEENDMISIYVINFRIMIYGVRRFYCSLLKEFGFYGVFYFSLYIFR